MKYLPLPISVSKVQLEIRHSWRVSRMRSSKPSQLPHEKDRNKIFLSLAKGKRGQADYMRMVAISLSSCGIATLFALRRPSMTMTKTETYTWLMQISALDRL